MKIILVFLLTVAVVLSGCSKGGESESTTSMKALPDLQLVYPRLEPSSDDECDRLLLDSSVSMEYPQISSRTNSWSSSVNDPEINVPIFSQYIEETKITFSEDNEVEKQINNALQRAEDTAIQDGKVICQLAKKEYDAVQNDEDKTEYSFYEYSYYTDQTVQRLDSTAFSIVTYYSGYYGIAHPDNTQEAMNFSTETGKMLSLKDVLTERGAEQLSQMVSSWVDNRAAEFGLFSLEDCQEVIENKFGSDHLETQVTDWYMTTDSLVLFFNPYEISPRSSGIIKMQLTGSQLSDVLKEEYWPGTPVGEDPGMIKLLYQTDFSAADSETIELTGSEIQLGIVAVPAIYNVAVYQISWAGDQAIEGNLLYRSNYLTADDLLVLEVEKPEDLVSFCIKLNSGDGREHTIYFDPAMEPGEYIYHLD